MVLRPDNVQGNQKSLPAEVSNIPSRRAKRGRPRLVANGNVDTELQRARLRRAQDAFRLRKEQHISSLEKQLVSLQNIVGTMSETFVGFSDELLTSGHAASDPALARRLKLIIEKFLLLSQKAVLEADDSQVDASKGDGFQPRGLEEVDNVSLSTNGGMDSSWIPSNEIMTMQQPLLTGNDLSAVPYSQNLSFFSEGGMYVPFPATVAGVVGAPPLNTSYSLPEPDLYSNIWSNSAPASRNFPIVVSYILAGRDSLAARLHFYTITLSFRSLRGDHGIAQDLARSMFRYKLRYIKRRRVLGVLGGVLDIMLHGTSQNGILGPLEVDDEDSQSKRARNHYTPTQAKEFQDERHPQAHIDDSVVKAAILKELARDGGSESDYLDAWAVERYLKDRWGLAMKAGVLRRKQRKSLHFEYDDMTFNSGNNGGPGFLDQAYDDLTLYAPTLVPGFQDIRPQIVLNAQSLVEKISMTAITLGEGPRYLVSGIDAAVQSFLLESYPGDTESRFKQQ